jgi:hypothetical protein
MLEGAQQAGMSAAHVATIAEEATPWRPALPLDDLLMFQKKGPQREYTREEVRGRAYHSIFRGKVIFLDTEDVSVMRAREDVLGPSPFVTSDQWTGRDCTRFLQLQFYNPLYGDPPVESSVESEYDRWLEDMACRAGFMSSFVQIGSLNAREAECPSEEMPVLPRSAL